MKRAMKTKRTLGALVTGAATLANFRALFRGINVFWLNSLNETIAGFLAVKILYRLLPCHQWL